MARRNSGVHPDALWATYRDGWYRASRAPAASRPHPAEQTHSSRRLPPRLSRGSPGHNSRRSRRGLRLILVNRARISSGDKDSKSGSRLRCQRPDQPGDLAQIIVELMIAIWQATKIGIGDLVRVQLRVRRRRGGISEAVVKIDRDSSGQLLAERTLGCPLITRPPSLPDKRCGDQHDRAELPLWRMLGERMDQDRPAERVTDDDRALVQARDLVLERRRPCGVARVTFVGHSWIADVVARPQLGPQARDQLVVPLVMNALASALDEEHLTFHRHG